MYIHIRTTEPCMYHILCNIYIYIYIYVYIYIYLHTYTYAPQSHAGITSAITQTATTISDNSYVTTALARPIFFGTPTPGIYSVDTFWHHF